MLKTDFQDGGHGSHLGFPIGRILAITDLRHPDASYQVQVNWHFSSEEQMKNIFFQDTSQCGHLGFPWE